MSCVLVVIAILASRTDANTVGGQIGWRRPGGRNPDLPAIETIILPLSAGASADAKIGAPSGLPGQFRLIHFLVAGVFEEVGGGFVGRPQPSNRRQDGSRCV